MSYECPLNEKDKNHSMILKYFFLLQSKLRKDAKAVEMHGLTETIGTVLFPRPDTPPNSCGSPMPAFEIQVKFSGI